MTDGTIKLRLRYVEYECPEGDEESVSNSEHHSVDSKIRLSGEDGEIYGIACRQMDDFDWIVVCKETESAKEGVWKDVTRSAMSTGMTPRTMWRSSFRSASAPSPSPSRR